MTSEAICLILDKAWEKHSRALIFVKDRGRFEISPELWDWEMYESIDTLCIFSKSSKIENYIDINYISEISIQTNDNRRDKEKGI